MSKIRLTGSNSGYVEIASAADAGNLTFVLPTSGTSLLGNGNNVYTGITTFTNDFKLEGGSYDVLWDASDNQLEFDDNAKLSFGAASDLQIYHNPNSSYIDNNTGHLFIRNNVDNDDGGNIYLQAKSGEQGIIVNDDGAVQIYHDNSQKLHTSSSGVIVTGIITATEINYTGNQNFSNRNILINGAMEIAQRGTAAVTVTTTAGYRCVDRWKTDIDGSGGGDFSHARSSDVPTGQGFRYSSKITTVTQASQPTSESNHHQLYQLIEQQDVYHLEWGTSAAKTCTLSFWVKGSITGTYGLWFSIYTTAATSYYWTNYTIDSANTWEKKIITIPGPTTGGNLSGSVNGTGFRVEWLLGVGSDSETGTLNEWTTSDTIRTAAGTVYLPENAGATWYLTGVQFETGSVATPFEHRRFQDEYLRCCRYYFGGATYNTGSTYYGGNYSTSNQMVKVPHPAPMRATPTAAQPSHSGGGTFTQVYENTMMTQYYISGDSTTSVQTSQVDVSAEL